MAIDVMAVTDEAQKLTAFVVPNLGPEGGYTVKLRDDLSGAFLRPEYVGIQCRDTAKAQAIRLLGYGQFLRD